MVMAIANHGYGCSSFLRFGPEYGSEITAGGENLTVHICGHLAQDPQIAVSLTSFAQSENKCSMSMMCLPDMNYQVHEEAVALSGHMATSPHHQTKPKHVFSIIMLYKQSKASRTQVKWQPPREKTLHPR